MIEITNIIQAMPDGNCLFYCISAFLDKSLYNCNRDELGCPKSKKLKEKEHEIQELLYEKETEQKTIEERKAVIKLLGKVKDTEEKYTSREALPLDRN